MRETRDISLSGFERLLGRMDEEADKTDWHGVGARDVENARGWGGVAGRQKLMLKFRCLQSPQKVE